MSCREGYVDMGTSRPKVSACVTKDSKNITVQVKGQAGEAWPAKGYVKVHLKRASNTSEVWIDVDTKKLGYCSDLSHSPKTVTFSNIGYIGSVMEVNVYIYKNSDYTGQYTSSIYNMFQR